MIWVRLQSNPATGEGQNGLLGGREIGLAAGDRFDLGKRSQAFGCIEHDLQLVFVERQVVAFASLADRGDRAETKVFQQPEQPAKLIGDRERRGSRSPRGSWWGRTGGALCR